MSLDTPISLRPVGNTDLPSLRSIYANAVGAIGPTAYSSDQVEVWRAFASEGDFDDFILSVHTYAAVIGGKAIGFCGIADDGHVASVYVRPDWFGQGIGSTLLSAVLRRYPEPTSGRYYAEASIFSLPLFERSGFRRTGTEQADRCGVKFERFLVERIATKPASITVGARAYALL